LSSECPLLTGHLNVPAAAGWALLVIAIEVITELTGIRKYKLTPEPKSPMEVLRCWPIFTTSGLATFLAVFYWRNSRMNQEKGN